MDFDLTSGLLSAFLLPHVDRHAFLVSCNAAPPRAHSVNISFAPDAQRVPNAWRFDLDNFCAKVPRQHTASHMEEQA